jgi:hypothetical protein
MMRSWSSEDRWWRVGSPTVALVRVAAPEDGSAEVREVVFLSDEESRADSVLASVAAVLGRTLHAEVPSPESARRGRPVAIHRTPLPFPATDAD